MKISQTLRRFSSESRRDHWKSTRESFLPTGRYDLDHRFRERCVPLVRALCVGKDSITSADGLVGRVVITTGLAVLPVDFEVPMFNRVGCSLGGIRNCDFLKRLSATIAFIKSKWAAITVVVVDVVLKFGVKFITSGLDRVLEPLMWKQLALSTIVFLLDL